MKTELLLHAHCCLSVRTPRRLRRRQLDQQRKGRKARNRSSDCRRSYPEGREFVLATGEFKAECERNSASARPRRTCGRASAHRRTGQGRQGHAAGPPQGRRNCRPFCQAARHPLAGRCRPPKANFDIAQAARAIAEGAILADFDSDTYRTDRKDRSIQSLSIVVPSGRR